MKRFGTDLSVAMGVRFTKTLYAQAVSQRFNTPAKFNLPDPRHPSFSEYELGAKLVPFNELH